MSDSTSDRLAHYGTFGLRRIADQIRSVRTQRSGVPEFVKVRIDRMRRDADRVAEALGRPLQGQRVLVVGPGQLLREARFLAVDNAVTCLDIDVIPKGIDPVGYGRMLVSNGPGRVIKTVGRKLIGNDRFELQEWRQQLGIAYLPDPECLVGDICDGAPDPGSWDVLASWSVFQHVPDPRAALRQCVAALRPGGVLYIGMQIWTCNAGHHDIRAFTGHEETLPLWAHLRPDQADKVQSSAWLNRFRLSQWREVFGDVCPGFTEYQERYGEDDYRARMTPDLRQELKDYDDEELYTVDAFYRWQKPRA